jgi:hypothetical protein
MRSSCSTDTVFAGSSPFEVRVMGVDSFTSPVRWYLIRLVCRQRPGSAWEVVHRFSDFDALAHAVSAHDDSLPSLPRKMPSLLLNGTEQQRRVIGLQQFAEAVLCNPQLLSLPAVGDFFDLDFGLWHATSSLPPRVDRAQQRAARMLQAEARRWLSMRKLQRARMAASLIQFKWKEKGVEGDDGDGPADFAARMAQAAAAFFEQSVTMGLAGQPALTWSLSKCALQLPAPLPS